MTSRERATAWLLLLALGLPACLSQDAPVATPVVPPPVPSSVPLPDLHYPATPDEPVVSGGRTFAGVLVPHFHIVYPAGAADDIAILPDLVDRLETRYADLAALLGEAPTYAIPVQLEHDPAAVHSSAPGMILYRRDGPAAYQDQVTHALTHVFTGYTGYPFFEEGLAVYTTMLLDGLQPWPLNGVAAGRQAGSLAATPRFLPLATAFRYPGLGGSEFGTPRDRPDTATTYLEAGAFAQFMIERYGLPAYRALGLHPFDGGEPVPGQVGSLAALETAFRTWLAGTEAAAAPQRPPPLAPAPTPVLPGPPPDAAALLQQAVAAWQTAHSVRFTISKLGRGEWVAPAYLHLFFTRPDNQAEVVVQDTVAWQHGPGGWTRLPAAQTPESTLRGAWQGLGAAASPEGPVLAAVLDGRPVWRASYFLAATPDLARYQLGGNSYATLWFGAADGRVYRFQGPGYDERFSDWDAPIAEIQP